MILVQLALFAFLASAANAGDLGPYSGEYHGVMRSDSSPIGYGEVEMRIATGTLTVRSATVSWIGDADYKVANCSVKPPGKPGGFVLCRTGAHVDIGSFAKIIRLGYEVISHLIVSPPICRHGDLFW